MGFFQRKKRKQEGKDDDADEDDDENEAWGKKLNKPKKKFNYKLQKMPSIKFNNSVVINVGLMKDTDKGLCITRGSRLPVKVQKCFNSGQVLQAATEKHANHDQFFCGLEDYVLLYPDQKIVANIPGSTVAFTVEKYKKELAKPFSKVDLYICKLHDLTSMVYSNDDSPDNNVVTPPDDGTTIDSYFNAAVEDNFPDETPGAATSSSTSSMSTVHKVFCPICNKKFPTTYIEEHADACLASKQDPTVVTIFDSDGSDSLGSIDDPELTTNLDVKELTRESICSAFG